MSTPVAPQTQATQTDEQIRQRRQRMRSIAIAIALGAFTLLFYAATIVRMGANVLNRPL